MVESGQVSVEEHVDIFQSNACGGATLPNDGALVGYAGETIALRRRASFFGGDFDEYGN